MKKYFWLLVGLFFYVKIQSQTPSITIIGDLEACQETELFANTQNAISIQWSTGETTPLIQVQSSGQYVCTASNGNGISSDTVEVIIGEYLPNNFLGNDTVRCGTVTLALEYPQATVIWNGTSTGTTYTVDESETVNVSVRLNECVNTDQIEVKIDQPLGINIGNDTFITCDQISQGVLLEVPLSDTYQWSTGETSQSIEITEFGMYSVEVSNGLCSSTDQISINSLQENNTMLFPSAFTPNGDGMNDCFRTLSQNLDDFSLKIYNRFGELIFETNDINDCWDGQGFGKEVLLDTYLFVASAYICNDVLVQTKGMVNVIY